MKTNQRILWVVVSILSCIVLPSCGNENFDTTSCLEIKLKSCIQPTSRGVDLNQQATELAEGQYVGVTILNALSEHNHVKWMVGSEGVLENTGSNVQWGESSVTVYAYQPYQRDWSGTNSWENFSVQTDQSTTVGYLDSDLLWSTQTANFIGEPIELVFSHKLSKINITISSDDIADLSNATIRVCHSNLAVQFNPQTGQLKEASMVSISDIKASVTTAESKTASCIIVPQEIKQGTAFIQVDHADKTYQYKLKNDITFQEGKLYHFVLLIKDGKMNDVTATAPDLPWG